METRPIGHDQKIFFTLIIGLSVGFAAVTTYVSYTRWANFEYRTFDLAYYVQAVWQLIHGRFGLTIENVPLLGNHVEPIVFLIAPIFAIVRHPIVFVVVQNVALASMAPIGYLIARRLFESITAACLAITLLVCPAASYIALHEFHPEALTAPLLLLLIYARATARLGLHWIAFVATLACKENMALVLAAYCIVFLLIERRRPLSELIRWYGGPLVVALTWLVICTKVITPALNSGGIDYAALYNRLGSSPIDIIWNFLAKPQLAGAALLRSVRHGNLLWALLLPFLALPLLRPRWLLIAAPIFLQHLLSWRASEWTIYFHYAAPLLPLMWIAAVEAVAMLQARWFARTVVPMEGRAPASPTGPENQRSVAGAPPSINNRTRRFSLATASFLIFACILAQLRFGPARLMASELVHQAKHRAERRLKDDFVAKIPVNATVVAPLPYLSHLAMREKIYSLHYILKGLKTLSRDRYQPPPPTDYVLIDYGDAATFDANAGYYHPNMRTTDGAVVPSSDRLLHDFLKQARWSSESVDQLTLFQRAGADLPLVAANSASGGEELFSAGGNELVRVDRLTFDAQNSQLNLQLRWSVHSDRDLFPWMILQLKPVTGGAPTNRTKGLCAVQVGEGEADERWRTHVSHLPPGEYIAEAMMVDNAKRVWFRTHGGNVPQSASLAPPVFLGHVIIPR